jgi:hypothetical protein
MRCKSRVNVCFCRFATQYEPGALQRRGWRMSDGQIERRALLMAWRTPQVRHERTVPPATCSISCSRQMLVDPHAVHVATICSARASAPSSPAV